MIKLTSDKCTEYIWFADMCLKKARAHNLTSNEGIQDGRTLVICKYNPREAILIVIPKGDFITHPRSGNLRKFVFTDSEMNNYTLTGITSGGYTKVGNAYQELTAIDAYTLIDNDRGSFVVTINEDELEVEWADAEDNYGNVYWIGDGDTPPVLSWHGPPSLQFPLDKKYSIPGLTVPVSGSNTSFHVWIYQDGVRLCHGPQIDPDDELASLLVGAAVATDSEGVEHLIAICSSTKVGIVYLQVYKSKDTGTTWEMIYEVVNRNCNTPAFISTNGRLFVYDTSQYLIASDLKSVSKVDTVSLSDVYTRTVVGAGGYESDYFYAGKQYLYPTLDATDKLKYATVITNAKFEHTGNGDVQFQTAVVPVYRGNPATQVSISKNSSINKPCTLSGDGYEAVFVATVNGTYCQAVWSGVHCYKDLAAVVKVPDCNASFNVSVTLLPQGITATYTESAATADMVISGPVSSGDMNNPGITGGDYTVANAYGTVEWSISCGTIDQNGHASFTGCSCPDDGTVTITATDSCGRSATLTALAKGGGYWVSNNDRCCLNREDVPEQCRPYMNCDIYNCHDCYMMEGLYLVHYQQHPGWIVWGMSNPREQLCNNCGPEPYTLITRDSYRWECP